MRELKKKDKGQEEQADPEAQAKEMLNKTGEKNLNSDSAAEGAKEITKNKQEYDALWDRFVRLQAEFENYKKRSYKERIEFIKFANEGLIMELLGIVDNFERGIKSAELKKDFDLLHQGVDMISKQLYTLLESKGLKKIKTEGEKFDPHKHEAVEVVEDEGVQDDIIVEELQPGYTLNDRIIRPARVKVHKCKEKKEEDKEENIKEESK
ncbi:MAG: nucleotide exchange factor GrpE [Omnitrophica bacterium]|nr:nucleotide exchange factor GrpE [Candidatus Omnitrophota bacterium]